jgi:tripartite-type tricarboxylate transporter receptor subunit TctC
MRFARRKFLHVALGAALLPALAGASWAQSYPNRPVTIIVPFAPGGASDVVGRIVADYLSRALGQQFVIENVAGAGGTTGTIRTMRATPDGYTIQLGQMGTHAAAVALYPNLAYRPELDFEPIGMIAGLPVVITARKDFPADNLEEFIAYVKANAGKVNAAHAGVGSITHTTCLLLHSLVGVHLQRHSRRRFARAERRGEGLCHQHGRAQPDPAERPYIEGSRVARVRCVGLERAVCA